ncbi:leukocyte cysteine proteinase inhibitor 1-like [Pristis pectinata]|uniref:leukocyte cysteine proteinase inhibitor 1-like n=1 Tax=Pristis pectinata TaxID=685728 RepID=UPI00223DC8A3|nr:leukocyte cysteine proteinase inhibitor 1-like [Pristis pectinata]
MAGQTLIPGGYIPTTPTTPEVKEAADTVKPAVEEQLGRKLDVYRAMFYRSQVVAGINYLIKVYIGAEDNYLHVKVFVPLPCTQEAPSLVWVHMDEKWDDPLIDC